MVCILKLFLHKKFYMMLNRLLVACAFFMFTPHMICAQQNDTVTLLTDRAGSIDSISLIDSSALLAGKKSNDSSVVMMPVNAGKGSGMYKILEDNIFLNSQGSPDYFIQSLKKTDSKEMVFYALLILVFLFAILKYLYPRYFSNLFRVFLNTSLRQSQLTDQLLQAKLPSLFFNFYFILAVSWYLNLLLQFYGKAGNVASWQLLLICGICLATIYFFKYCILKFTGWITGFKQEADTYIFIIFLINKIMAICLVPLIILIAFSDRAIAGIAVIVSFILIISMILMRFFRSYSLLQNRLKVSRLHFLIYIIGIEIIPLLVIYKLALIFMSKSL
jgi:hypothetical protein